MRWWGIGCGALLALSLATGCSTGTQRMAKQELDRYNMKSYREGNERQLMSGTTLNTALLKALKTECSKRGIKLTHETYAEGLDGNISYSYFINGDARHFLLVHVYPSENDRIREIGEMYGLRDGSAAAATNNETNVIGQLGNTALVYTSSGVEKSKYSKDIKAVFDKVMEGIQVQEKP